MTIILGADPGMAGAFGLLTRTGEYVGVIDMPVVGEKRKKDISARLMWEALCGFDVSCAAIENVHAMPKQGVASSFKFGRGKGLIEMVVASFGCPVEMPTASKWKRDMSLSSAKDESRKMAIALWPEQATLFKRVKDDGRAEALLLAEWCRRLMVERGNI